MESVLSPWFPVSSGENGAWCARSQQPSRMGDVSATHIDWALDFQTTTEFKQPEGRNLQLTFIHFFSPCCHLEAGQQLYAILQQILLSLAGN